MDDFRVYVTGKDAELLARELSAELESQFATRVEPETITSTEDNRDPLQVAQFVLTIPISVWATVQLTERVEVGQKLVKLRAWLAERLASRTGDAQLQLPSGDQVALADSTPPQLLDAAATAREQVRGTGPRTWHELLCNLLASLFTSEELRVFVRHHPAGDRLFSQLPGNVVSRSYLCFETVELLEREGLVRAALFTHLRKALPERLADIDQVAQAVDGRSDK